MVSGLWKVIPYDVSTVTFSMVGRGSHEPNPDDDDNATLNRIKGLGRRRASRHQPAGQAAASQDGSRDDDDVEPN